MRRLLRVVLPSLVFLLATSCQVAAGVPVRASLSPEDALAAVLLASPEPVDLAALAREYHSDLPAFGGLFPVARVEGATENFWVQRQAPVEHFQVSAQLRVAGRHAYWYVQPGFPASDASLRRAAQVFDSTIYPEVRRLVLGADYAAVDDQAPVSILNGDVPGVAGYVSSADFYPRTVQPYSNEREMIYLNLRALQAGSDQYLATLAHEFTHVVHARVHPSEDAWVKEGLGDLLPSLVLPGRSPASAAFAAAPETQLNAWSSPPSSAHYQAGAWFLRYFIDQFGEDALPPVLNRRSRGPASFNAVLAQRDPTSSFATFFGQWVVANLTGVGSVEAGGYVSGSPRPPLTVPVSGGGSVDGLATQFGTDYYDVPPGAEVTLEFDGAPTVALVGTTPHSGDAMWYAGRADGVVSSMTRALDLSTVDSAVLEYWIWYDIELDYDYAYVSVSTDGGVTWSLLDTPSMIGTNPAGNNLGAGYTGRSGAGERPEWVNEAVDLSNYAGGTVWVRFSYVTDDAFTGEGVVLDDIRVQSLGYADGAEDDGRFWSYQGWARVGADLPERWLVQVVQFFEGSAGVASMPVDPGGRAAWTSNVAALRMVVAVSGATPVTLQRAPYQLRVR